MQSVVDRGWGGGAKKHKIHGAFGGNLFMTYFYRERGEPWLPWPPMDLLLEIEKCLGRGGWGAPPKSATAVRARTFPTQQRGPFVQGPLELQVFQYSNMHPPIF